MQCEGQFADFVEEDGASVCGTEVSQAILCGTGEGAFSVSEEFAFGECSGDSGAVDADKGVGGAFFVKFVDDLGETLFSGTGLAEDDDGGVRDGGGFVCLLYDALEGVAVSDEAVTAAGVVKVEGSASKLLAVLSGGAVMVEEFFGEVGLVGVDNGGDAVGDGLVELLQGESVVDDEEDLAVGKLSAQACQEGHHVMGVGGERGV